MQPVRRSGYDGISARPITADLFAPLPDVDRDVVAGLDLLARSRPLWPVEPARWSEAVAAVLPFEARWGGQARACGWSEVQLYGLHRGAPYANLAAMGAAWVAARSGHRVTAVTAADMLMVTPTGATLRMFRGRLDQGSVLAWNLCRP